MKCSILNSSEGGNVIAQKGSNPSQFPGPVEQRSFRVAISVQLLFKVVELYLREFGRRTCPSEMVYNTSIVAPFYTQFQMGIYQQLKWVEVLFYSTHCFHQDQVKYGTNDLCRRHDTLCRYFNGFLILQPSMMVMYLEVFQDLSDGGSM